MKFSTSHEVPDYGKMEGPANGKAKKTPMKKVHPEITVRNLPPHIHNKLKVGQKIKAHVTLMPTSKGMKEGGNEWDPDGNHVTMEMHSMEPEMPEADDQPAMKTAGAALQEFMDKKKKHLRNLRRSTFHD